MPTTAVTSPARGTTARKGMPYVTARMPAEYAPTPKKAPWPREISPVEPTRMLSPMAAMAEIPMRFTT